MVGRSAFAFARDFLAAIDLFLVPGCSDRTLPFEIAGLATIDGTSYTLASACTLETKVDSP